MFLTKNPNIIYIILSLLFFLSLPASAQVDRKGQLIKIICTGNNESVCRAVYYVGANNKRFVFPNKSIFDSWYTDFSSVKNISASEMASYQIGGNITYKPGYSLVKITSDPKVYVVDKGGILRWLTSEASAKKLFGKNWKFMVRDLPDEFFATYSIGKDVSSHDDLDPQSTHDTSKSIDIDLGLLPDPLKKVEKPKEYTPTKEPEPTLTPEEIEDLERAKKKKPKYEDRVAEATKKGPPPMKGTPDPAYGGFTYILPPEASELRLSLPAHIDDISVKGTGGYGLHGGGHFEGLDHVWFHVNPGVVVRSWADGTVTGVRPSGDVELGEMAVTIDYGELEGWHGEILTPLVSYGDTVKRGDPIGYGMSFGDQDPSAEFGLTDKNRTDGIISHGGGVSVSPFDYLNDSDKRALVDKYKAWLDKEVASETSRRPKWYQPFLTNELLFHQYHEGTVVGEWLLISSPWGKSAPSDFLVFLDTKNPYYNQKVVLATDDDLAAGLGADHRMEGTYEDYESENQVIIVRDDGTIFYGIYFVDETQPRATLTIEWQKESFPESFSGKAAVYVERTNLGRGEDVKEYLGQ